MTPTESRRLASLIQTFSPSQKADFYYFTIVENQDPTTYIMNMEKASFGGDKSAAGRYAAEQRWKGHVKAQVKRRDVRAGIIETVRREEGMSVKIDSGLQPTKGYMVARKEYSKIVSADDFFDAKKGRKILGDFLKENRERFQKDQYLGIWFNTKNGKVYLDITDNISGRKKAESLGKERNQISIWDVVNKVEIQTGGTGEG